MKTLIQRYKKGSVSGTYLKQTLGLRDIANAKPNERLVLNWGSSEQHPFHYINHPQNVILAINKLDFFKLHEVSKAIDPTWVPRIPEWTTELTQAQQWVNDGYTVLQRNVLTGSKGNGILVVSAGSLVGLSQAPLYTKYRKKKREYRVHLFKSTDSIFVQKKLKTNGVPSSQIQNIDNGYVFSHTDSFPEDVERQAYNAVRMLGLDFGAVDVGYNEHDNEATVYEVNTAPALIADSLKEFYVHSLGLCIQEKTIGTNN